jgi:hypothetical protein
MTKTALSFSLFMLASLGAAAEAARTKEQSDIVKYTDGTAERYTVKWTLDVTAKIREEGAAFVPYQGATENRKCVLSIDSGVVRSVSLVTRLGQAIPLPGMNRTLNNESRSEPCKEPRDQREKALGDARNAALERFDRITRDDLEDIRKETQASAGVVGITVQ